MVEPLTTPTTIPEWAVSYSSKRGKIGVGDRTKAKHVKRSIDNFRRVEGYPTVMMS